MPHMANLAWLQTYIWSILLMLLMSGKIYFNTAKTNKLNTNNNSNKTAQWKW